MVVCLPSVPEILGYIVALETKTKGYRVARERILPSTRLQRTFLLESRGRKSLERHCENEPKTCQPRILYEAKLFFMNPRETFWCWDHRSGS